MLVLNQLDHPCLSLHVYRDETTGTTNIREKIAEIIALFREGGGTPAYRKSLESPERPLDHPTYFLQVIQGNESDV